jgi:hypothetical protein
VKEYENPRSACKVTGGKSEVKRPLGIPKSRRNDNIKSDFTRVLCEAVDRNHIS